MHSRLFAAAQQAFQYCKRGSENSWYAAALFRWPEQAVCVLERECTKTGPSKSTSPSDYRPQQVCTLFTA